MEIIFSSPLLMDSMLHASSGSFLLKIILNSLALIVAARFLEGVEVRDFTGAAIVALVLALLNATIGNVLDFVTLPLRFLTLGLFSFVVDAVVLLIAAHFLQSLKIKSFSWAIVLAVVLSLLNTLFYKLLL